jgi:OmpA-OmpF porin, OOP family
MRTALLLGTALALTAPTAHALGNEAPLDLNHFHPATGSARILTLDLADVGPPKEFVGELILHYADLPLVYTVADRFQSAVVRNRVTADAAVSYSILPYLQLSLAMPITLHQSGDTVSYLDPIDGSPRTLPPVAGIGQGDLRLQAKGRFWQNQSFRAGGALEVAFPTGNANSFLGSSGVTGTARLFGDYVHDRLTVALTLGWRYALVEERLLNVKAGNSLLYGVGAQLEVYRYQGVPISLLAEVYGRVHSSFDSVTGSPAEAMLAAKAQVSDFSLFLGAGPGLNSGYGVPNVRVMAGVAYAWQYRPRPSPPPPPPPPPAPPPKVVVVPVQGDRLQLWQPVFFDFDKDTIKSMSHSLLDDVARVLRTQPELGRIRIDGHTDDVGGDDYNLDLSRRRARSVYNYMVEHGVTASRLTFAGYGKACPVTSNQMEEGRAVNRRVDFILIERERRPPAPGKCPEKPATPTAKGP